MSPRGANCRVRIVAATRSCNENASSGVFQGGAVRASDLDTMTPVEELAAVDAEWDAISSPVEELATVDAEWDAISSRVAEHLYGEPEDAEEEPPISGTFGHVSERRLGLRVPTACWALLSDGDRGIYARAVELSPTGAVLKLLDGRDVRFDDDRSFGLDIFLPSAPRPIHATARPARAIGDLEAFEFSSMNAADRLTLAEHLDDLVNRPATATPLETPAHPGSPPVSWRNFVLSLKRRKTPAAVASQHSDREGIARRSA